MPSPRPPSQAFSRHRLTIEQNHRRRQTRLALPVLTIAGAQGLGGLVEGMVRGLADDVRGLIVPDCGHYPAEEAPEAMLAALTPFLASYGTCWPEF